MHSRSPPVLKRQICDFLFAQSKPFPPRTQPFWNGRQAHFGTVVFLVNLHVPIKKIISDMAKGAVYWHYCRSSYILKKTEAKQANTYS